MPMTLIVLDEGERPRLMKVAKRNLAHYFTTRTYGAFMDMHGWSRSREAIWDLAASFGRSSPNFDYDALASCIDDEMVHEVCLFGTPSEVRREAMIRYGEIADSLAFYPTHDGSLGVGDAMTEEMESLSRVILAFGRGTPTDVLKV